MMAAHSSASKSRIHQMLKGDSIETCYNISRDRKIKKEFGFVSQYQTDIILSQYSSPQPCKMQVAVDVAEKKSGSIKEHEDEYKKEEGTSADFENFDEDNELQMD